LGTKDDDYIDFKKNAGLRAIIGRFLKQIYLPELAKPRPTRLSKHLLHFTQMSYSLGRALYVSE
jgi:hypothetical protein